MPEYQQGHEETLPEGVYDFVVVDAIEKQSQNGNPMIELKLMVNGPDGSKNGGIRIFDHLTFTPKSYWKIDAFRIATGEKLVPGQTVGFEAEDCVDRSGRVWLKVESYQGRNRNKVGEYLDANAENAPAAAPPKKEPPPLSEELGDDDIPQS
jgi:Protein of unknown function (DUF669)